MLNKPGCESMAKENIENSPFFVEYKGKKTRNKGFTFHPRTDADGDLKKFFNERFGDISNGEILEQIVYDYYFRFAHDRTYYERTIVALIHKDELKLKNNPTIFPLLVLNRFTKDNEHDILIDEEIIANYDLMQYVAYYDLFNDVSADMKKEITDVIYNDAFSISGFNAFQDLKNFNEDTLKNFFVIEIPLNNYLDEKLNGVYCYQDNDADGGAIESLHVGLAIAKDNDKDVNATPIPIIYVWSLKEDFNINIHLVEKIDIDHLQRQCQRYNVGMFAVLKFFEIANYGYEDKLSKNKQEQRRLQEKMDELKQQEQELVNLIKQESNDK